ncbi:MAG TPA: hypothetical protein VK633_11665, partial [Verrucomicrobiae bacterium]|nr:hypothetical protein [Verrucomicrobiae bacterium]
MQAFSGQECQQGINGCDGASADERGRALLNTKTMKTIRTLLSLIIMLGVAVIASQGAAPTASQGIITGKQFSNITGTAVAGLTNNAKFPNSPDAL